MHYKLYCDHKKSDNKQNSFCRWSSHTDECFQMGNADILHSDLYKREECFLRAYCNVMQKLDASVYGSINSRAVHQYQPATKGTISISNRSHFHNNTETASAAAKVWQLLPPVFLPIAAYKFTSLLLPVWLMSVIMALLLFTQHIWPSPLSAICWLTSSTFYWLSLMGQLKVVLTGLWNVTALSLMIVCEIGARKGIF